MSRTPCAPSLRRICRANTRPAITSCLNPLAGAPVADRILIIRLGALGDVARTLPALGALRAHYPGAQLTWLVERGASGVVEGHPWIDETLIFPREELVDAASHARPIRFARRLRAFLRELRSRRFDLVVDFHSILKTGLISRASGAPVRVGYATPVAREGAWLFATHRAQLSREKKSRFERNAALVEYLGIDPKLHGEAILPISLEADANLELERMSRAELIAIHPGNSAATPYKRYSAEAYGKLARELKAKRHSRCIVTYGPGPDERAFADAVVAASGGAAELAPRTERVADLAALFARCRLYIGGDSGPLHIASLVGTPVVQILGPTDPVENAPFAGTPSRTLRVPLACSPCRRGCAAATCMRLVQPERVFAAAVDLLSGRDTPSRGRSRAHPTSDLAASSPP